MTRSVGGKGKRTAKERAKKGALELPLPLAVLTAMVIPTQAPRQAMPRKKQEEQEAWQGVKER